jgi:hypothetical protein
MRLKDIKTERQQNDIMKKERQRQRDIMKKERQQKDIIKDR